MPSFCTKPGGKTRDANARRKISLNSASKPPIPISSNLKLGDRIALGAALKEDERRYADDFFLSYFLVLVFSLRALLGDFIMLISVLSIKIPLV